MQNLFDFVILGNASIAQGYTYKHKYLKILGSGYYMAYFFFNRKRAHLVNKKFNIKPDFETARAVWNLLDTRGIKHALNINLSVILPIKFRKKLYLKKTMPEIDKDYIKNLIGLIGTKKTSAPLSNNILNSSYLEDIMDKKTDDKNKLNSDVNSMSSFSNRNGDLLLTQVNEHNINGKSN